LFIYKILSAKLIKLIDVYRVNVIGTKFSALVDRALENANNSLTTGNSGNSISGPTVSTIGNIPQYDTTTGTSVTNGLAVGVAANNLVQLDATAKLPALDASQLTNLPGGGDVYSPASNTDNYIPQWNGANTKTLKNGLAVGTSANNLVQLDGTSKLPAVDGSQLTNLPTLANPMTSVGDMIYGAVAGLVSRLVGNTTTTKKFLRQTGTGTASNTPEWDTVTKTDVGLSNVPNTDCTNPANITQNTSYRFVTDTEKGTWNGKQDSLTFGILDTNAVKIDSASVTDNEYARFTGTGLESRSTSEVLGDIGAQASLGYTAENVTNKDTDVTMGGATPSNTKYPSQAATKSYVTNLFGTVLANPMTAIGDMIYGAVAGVASRLVGNTTITKKFLTQTGTGTDSAMPTWDTLSKSDVGLNNVTNDAQVTSVSGSAPIAVTSGTTPSVSIPVATASADGYLDKDDFATFNGKQDALTFGIADTNKVQINAADVADNDYAKFTTTGLEGRSYSEVLSDIGAEPSFSTLPVTKGGTGIAAVAVGSILAANTTNVVSAVSSASGNKILTNRNASVAWTDQPQVNRYVISYADTDSLSDVAFAALVGVPYSPDGIAVIDGDLVLFNGLVTSANNGVYRTTVIGGNLTALTRIQSGQNTTGAGTLGDIVYVNAGTTYHNVTFRCISTASNSWNNDGNHVALTEATSSVLTISDVEVWGTTPTIEVQQASTTLSGYLSSTDWNTFNGKQAALTFGIADTNAVRIDDAGAADNEYARFTANGIEGRAVADVASDIGAVTLAGNANGQTIADGALCITQDTVTFSNTTTTVDWRASNKKTLTMTDNIGTILAFTNPPAACNLILKVVQDGTGSRLITAYDTDIKWAGGTIPTLSTAINSIDILSFYFDGTNYFGTILKGFA